MLPRNNYKKSFEIEAQRETWNLTMGLCPNLQHYCYSPPKYPTLKCTLQQTTKKTFLFDRRMEEELLDHHTIIPLSNYWNIKLLQETNSHGPRNLITPKTVI